MGLDMYMYNATTPGINSNEVYKYEDLKALGYSIFDDEDVKEKYRKDIQKMAIPCMVDAEFTDYQKVRGYLGTEEVPEIYGMSQDVFFLFADGKSFTISETKFREFSYRKTKKFWVLKLERIGYWRNHYDLQDYIYALKKKERVNIENCGYFLMSDKNLASIDEVTSDEYNLRDYANEYVLYHEWY